MRCGRASPLALGGRGVPSGDGNGGLDLYQDSATRSALPVFSTSPRRAMTGTSSEAAFEVTRDNDLGVGVGVKDLVVEPSEPATSVSSRI